MNIVPWRLSHDIALTQPLRVSDFERYQANGVPAHRIPRWFLALALNHPISGPVALGYGCHFGLALFRPVNTS